MTLLSWIYMLAVWALIIALNIFCFTRMFLKPDRSFGQEQDDGEE